MARIDSIIEPSEDSELKRLYQEITAAGLGEAVPINWFTAQGQRPDIVRATWALVKGVLLGGRLPPAVKQMIALSISVQNDCRYCQVVHGGALEQMGVPRETIESCAHDLEVGGLAPAQRALVRFAVKAAREANAITDADVDDLRDHGVDEGEIIEVMMMAAFTNFINTWADVSGIPLDGH